MSVYGAIDGVESGGGRHSSPSPQQHKGKDDKSNNYPWILVGALSFLLFLSVSLTSHKDSYTHTSGALYQATNAGQGLEVRDTVNNYHDEDEELFYDEQLVNHFNGDKSTWSNRYFKSTNYFQGPGHPIFMVVGGEGAMDTGMLYPFITQHLAPHFGAAVIQIEHRFYGQYQPIIGRDATVSELIELLTPQQAMADMVQLTKSFKKELNCDMYDRSSVNYCPVISVGGSVSMIALSVHS